MTICYICNSLIFMYIYIIVFQCFNMPYSYYIFKYYSFIFASVSP